MFIMVGNFILVGIIGELILVFGDGYMLGYE